MGELEEKGVGGGEEGWRERDGEEGGGSSTWD
jgi:hypothetical protein